MALYIRFMFCLAVGLVGLGIVLKTIIETLFHDWDLFAEIGEAWRAWMRGEDTSKHARVEDLLLDRELDKAENDAPSLRMLDERRKQLREVAAVESRLKRPQGPIVLTPLPSPRGAVNLTPVAPPPVVPIPRVLPD